MQTQLSLPFLNVSRHLIYTLAPTPKHIVVTYKSTEIGWRCTTNVKVGFSYLKVFKMKIIIQKHNYGETFSKLL